MAKRRTSTSAAPVRPGLTLHSDATRVEELLRDRERLLREVNKKKLQLEQVRARASMAEQEASTKMRPLIERHDTLVRELTALFDELLAEGRLATRARNAVGRVRRSLEVQGILEPLPDSDDDPEPFGEPGEPWDEPEEPEHGRRGHARSERSSGPSSGAREVPSARQPGQGARTLREIFRALVRLVHPDHAREDAERERRTELMKEVTRAFEMGDLARLIELERAWQNERVLAGDGDPALRCRELERSNRELAAQAKQLSRELREAKRELAERSLGPIDELLDQASRELDDIAAICEFVKRFRDGKISLAEFSRGPGVVGMNEDEPAPPRKRRRRR